MSFHSIYIIEIMNLDCIFLQLQFKSRQMDDFLFKVVNGAVEIVKSPF